VAPLLGDPVRAVRLEAASVVGGLPTAGLDPSTRSTLAHALDEYRASELANADRPESHLALGLLETKLGHAAEAERELATAIRIAPWFVPGYVNLADLYRATGRDGEGETLLRRAVAIAPENADAHHALGLLLVRQHRLDDALIELERATTLRPDARNAYVLGVALHSVGKTARAVEVLDAAHDRHPGDRDVLVALVTINRDRGAMEDARRQADALVALAPDDPGARRLRDELAATH
jgi:tetratricopeptide (TPR) repeat protein